MSSINSRLKIFDALTLDNPPPIPLNDETVTFSLPVIVPFDPTKGDEDYWNTKVLVTARPGSGYTGSVDIFYTRLDLSSFDNGVVVVNEIPYDVESLVRVLNRLHSTFLTVDDLEPVQILEPSKGYNLPTKLMLRARIDSLGWVGSVVLLVQHWVADVPDPSQDIVAKTYYFDESLVWVVKHGLKTTNFIESLRNSAGVKLLAYVHVVDDNEFHIQFTEPEAGRINVTFFISS